MTTFFTRRLFATGVILTAACNFSANAQNTPLFPIKPVTIVVPYGAGGAADIMARVIAENLTQKWGQPVVVENKPGGTGVVGITYLVRAPKDGYTLGAIPVADLAVNQHIYKNRPFNVEHDLSPVVAVGAVPNILVTSDTKDINELLRKLKSSAAPTSYSSPGVGSQAQLAAVFFNKSFQTDASHIPYNGLPAALAAIAGGHVDFMFAQWPSVQKIAEADKVKIIAIAASKRTPLVPNVPTLKEVSGKDLGDFFSWSAIMAPAETPVKIREKIAHDVTQILQDPKIVERFSKLGAQPIGGTPASLQELINKDSKNYKAIIESSGIEAQQ